MNLTATTSLTVPGYSIDNTNRELGLCAVPAAETQQLPCPISRSSRPILEMLAGKRDLDATLTLVQSDYNLTSDPEHEELALLLTTTAPPCEAVVIRYPVEGVIVPALSLRVEAGHWRAKGYVLKAADVSPAVLLRFQSASVRALLELTTEAFEKVLEVPEEVESRFDYLCRTNAFFTPTQPDNFKWSIASWCPYWRQLGMKSKMCAIDWNASIGRKLNNAASVKREAARFRKVFERLKLPASDMSDS